MLTLGRKQDSKVLYKKLWNFRLLLQYFPGITKLQLLQSKSQKAQFFRIKSSPKNEIMKAAAILSFLLPFALATPMAEANPFPEPAAALLPRNSCVQDSSADQGCDYDPFHSERRATFIRGQAFTATCKINARPVTAGGTTNVVWDWVPASKCWISAHWTQSGCESKFMFTTMKSGRQMRLTIL